MRRFVGGLSLTWAMGALSLVAAVDESKLPPASTNQADFLRDIRPILDGHCLKCHGPEKPKSGFRVDGRVVLLKGGENGVAVVPGQSAKSPLIHFVAGQVEDMEMPPKGKGDPLTAQQIGLLRAWIDQGLPWSGPEMTESKHWEITPALGWTTVRGNEQKFRELEWYREGWNGGAESFLIEERQGDGANLTIRGHALRDDYKLTLAVERKEGRFVRAGYEQFRKYFNNTGGYWPATPIPPLDRDLHLDMGQAWIEAGGTTAFGLHLTGGYEYHFREGDKSVLQWMPMEVVPGSYKAVLPNAKHIDEHRQLLRLDARYDWRQLQLTDAFRFEFYELETKRPFVTAGFPIVLATQRMTEGSDTRNLANAFKTELQLRDWFLVSAGYLFTHADGEEAFRQTSVDGSGAPAGQFWNGRGITLEQSGHMFNANLQLGLWEHMTFSSGVQTDWNRQRTFGRVHFDDTDPLTGTIFFITNYANGLYDRFTAEERFTLRNTQLPFTVLYGEARFRQEQIEELQELSPVGTGFGSVSDFARETDAFYDWREYRAGFSVSPWSRVSLNAYAQHRDRDSDYDHERDERPPGAPAGVGYPAFITARQTTTDEVGTKLAVRPTSWLKTTFSFKAVLTDYDTVTDSATAGIPTDSTPGGRVSAGEYDAHVYSLNATLTPWRRLYLFSTFSFQDSRTETEDHQSPSIVPFRGNVYSVLNTAQYALTELTDLQLGYDFSCADYSQNNAASGLPLGIEYHRHGVRAGVSRRFLKRFLANLEYVFSYYDEPTSGNANDFTAHGLFATLHVRWK